MYNLRTLVEIVLEFEYHGPYWSLGCIFVTIHGLPCGRNTAFGGIRSELLPRNEGRHDPE